MSNLITKRLLDVYEMSKKMGIYSAVAFEKRAGIAGSSINKWAKEGKDASIESAVKILESFPNVSAEWLMRGKGSMELSECQSSNETSDKSADAIQATIIRLEDENKFLRSQLETALNALQHAHEHYNK